MARITQLPVNNRLKHQKGIAALLLVLLTGLSATFIAMGTMSYVRGTQKSQRTVHAQTQAEINAWAGVQALTGFLDTGTNLIKDFSTLGTLSFSRTGNNGATLATAAYQGDCSSMGTTPPINVCFDVTGTSAQSNVTLRVTYRITGTSTSTTSHSISNPMVFNGDLDITGGGLNVTGHEELKNIAVNGDLTLSGSAKSSVSGCATGDIYVNGGGITADAYLYSAGGDVKFDSVAPDNVSVWGVNVDLSGGGSYNSIKAQGNIKSRDNITANFMHADNIKASGAFGDVKVNTHYTLGNQGDSARQFKTLTGGGNLYAVSKSHLPLFQEGGSGVIAGRVLFGDPYKDDFNGGVLYDEAVANLTLDPSIAIEDPPKPPNCNVEVKAFDVNDAIDEANYIFYFDSETEHPMLKVQNVWDKKKNKNIDGTYDLTTNDILKMNGSDFFKCGYDGNVKCVKHDNGQWSGGSHLDVGWNFVGLHSFPTGIVVFGGVGKPEDKNLSEISFKLSSMSNSKDHPDAPMSLRPLYNSLFSTGSIILPDGGGQKRLVAPYHAGEDKATKVCDQDFYPTQLCQRKKDGSGFEFVTSTDETGKATLPHPVANNAIMANKDFDVSKWTISGHVLIGADIKNGAGKTTIEGGLLVGLNHTEDSEDEVTAEFGAGGFDVNIEGLAADQLLTGIGGEVVTTGGTQITLAGYQVEPR